MNIANFSTGIAGEYRFVVTRPDGTQEDTGWFHNLILDQGLDRIGSAVSAPIFNYCRVGTGASTPVVTQVALDSQLAASAVNNQAASTTNDGSPLYRTTITYNFAFAQGAVVGNISEVGVGWSNVGNTLFSRALILDGNGQPVTITLVAIDQLTVYYRLRIAPPVTDATGTMMIGSTSYGYTSRIASAASFASIVFFLTYGHDYIGGPGLSASSAYAAGSTLGAITAANPTGTGCGAPNNATVQPYVNGTFYRDTIWNWSISTGNGTGGIQAILFALGPPYNYIKFQVRFDTPIPKTSTNVLTLTNRFSWARE